MTAFWLILLGLAVLTLVSLVVPWQGIRRRLDDWTADRRSLNIEIFRARIGELEQELESGQISKDEFEALKTEQEKALLQDIDPAGEVAAAKANPQKLPAWLLPLLLLSLPAFSFWLYLKFGAAAPLAETRWLEETRALMTQAETPQSLVDTLSRRVEDNPEIPEGWVMLGRAYQALGRPQDALSAYQNLAVNLQKRGQNPAAAYGLQAQVLFGMNNQVTPEVRNVIDQALSYSPEETQSLSILGIEAFQKQNYEGAIAYWEDVLRINPNDRSAEALKSGIARARQLLEQNTDAAGVDAGESSAATESAEIRVRVDVDEAVLGEIPSSTVVYILARPTDGRRVPLAVTRTTVAALPLELVLNDSMAMSPDMTLSTAQEVRVVARASLSGRPIPQAGDFEGRSEIVPVSAQSTDVVSITISERLSGE